MTTLPQPDTLKKAVSCFCLLEEPPPPSSRAEGQLAAFFNPIGTYMKRLILTIGLSLSLLIPARAAVIPDTIKSLVELTFATEDGRTGVCTGFVVNLAAALTAKHCVLGEDLTVDGVPSHVIKADEVMALVAIVPESKVPLVVRKKPLEYGEPLTAFGYGYGVLQVFKRNLASFKDGDIGVDGPLAPGMSGGPIVDGEGKVVGLIQATQMALGVGCGQDEIRKFIK